MTHDDKPGADQQAAPQWATKAAEIRRHWFPWDEYPHIAEPGGIADQMERAILIALGDAFLAGQKQDATSNWKAIVSEKNQRIGELEVEKAQIISDWKSAEDEVHTLRHQLAEAQQAREAEHTRAVLQSAVSKEMIRQRDTLRGLLREARTVIAECMTQDLDSPSWQGCDVMHERITAELKEERMKTREQVQARLAEIRSLLDKETQFVRDNPDRSCAKMHRLQGNIGVLEWVLREAAVKETPDGQV